jgi:hypothetical protein
MNRTHIYRTLRSDFIDLCDGNRVAALLLDYFWQQGNKAIERQMNGSIEAGYIPLSWNYAIGVILLPVGKNSVKRAIEMLIERAYITPHSQNNVSSSNQVNRYRPNVSVIQGDLNRWSMSAIYEQPALPRSVQTQGGSGWTQSGSAQTQGGSTQTQGVGLAGPQEVVKESVEESAAAATEPPPPFDPIQIYEAWAGRIPTKLELRQVIKLAEQHGEAETRAAFEDAALKGGKSLKYVAAILAGDKGPAVSVAPVYVADEVHEVISLEERRALRAQMMNGGA